MPLVFCSDEFPWCVGFNHQEFVGDARAQSIDVYFDGGFLYNIDRLLAARDSNYRQGSIVRRSNEIFAQHLTNLTGDEEFLSQARFGSKGIARKLSEVVNANRCLDELDKYF